MPKKIIHRAHGESPKAFLNRRTFAAIFTQIGENKIACANQQMDRERIAFKKPHPDRRIHQPDECSSAILVNCDANRSGSTNSLVPVLPVFSFSACASFCTWLAR